MSKAKRIIIIGGVAGGASAAARARRLSEESEIIMFERGEYVSFANCGLPYHIGGTIAERNKLLVQTPASLFKRFKIDVRTKTEVTKINRTNKEVSTRNLETGEEKTEKYDDLILSPGALPFVPPIPGIKSKKVFTLRNIPDMDAIKHVVDKENPQTALIIGAGAIGLEMAEAFREHGIKVVLVELLTQVMAPADPEMAAPLGAHLRLHGVDLRLGSSVTGITEKGDKLSVQLSTSENIECDLVILSIGVRPDVSLAKDAGLTIGERGGIVVNEQMRTNDPNIYAVGDVAETTDLVGGFKTLVPLASPANRQGRIAADNVFGRNTLYKKTQGTAICKVFDLAIAMTGLNEKTLKRIGMKYEKIYIHPANHASYYPGAQPISLKLIFSPEDGKILGAQAVGASGVDKRIDVLAVAIRAGLTVYDLEDQELCYAPPFGSAKDPINYAGFVASNFLRGDMGICHVDEVLKLASNQIVLDVRTPAEIEAGGIPGALNIPVDELRGRLGELSKDKEYLVSCQVGLRGYIATRILTQNGFKCRNLTGGYKTYSAFTGNTQNNSGKKSEMHDDSGAEADVKKKVTNSTPAKTIDATGLQCPGPILQLKNGLESIKEGESLTILASDPGFATDVVAWCHSTGNKLIDVIAERGTYKAIIRKQNTVPSSSCSGELSKNKTIIVFSNDLDKVIAAFIIANGAASMGSNVTLFFTFWGLTALCKGTFVPTKKSLIERMFCWMLPHGATKLKLSKMHMNGMGTKLMKYIMKNKNVPSLPELMESAKKAGVNLVACAMSMNIMGIKHEQLIDGVTEGGVAMYLDKAESGNVNLFI